MLGRDTWFNESWESWRYTGNTEVWGQLSADLELGIVYLPTEMPTNDYYGGHRPGDNLFSDSVVALDIETGERLWHFQFIHHDVGTGTCPAHRYWLTWRSTAWSGAHRPAEQAGLAVRARPSDRRTDLADRGAGDATVRRTGELLSPTQPFPTRPPAYDRQGVSEDDLIDFTPELRAEAMELVSKYLLGPIFTPPVVAAADGPYGTLMLPSVGGGTNCRAVRSTRRPACFISTPLRRLRRSGC